MCGSYPATRDHKIVPLNHSSARLDSSTNIASSVRQFPNKTRGVGGSPLLWSKSGRTYISPSSSGITSTRFLQRLARSREAFSHKKRAKKKKAYARPTRTIRSRSRNSSVQNSLSFDRASSRSKSRPFVFLNYFSQKKKKKKFYPVRGEIAETGGGVVFPQNDIPDDEGPCRFDPSAFAQRVWRNGRQVEEDVGRGRTERRRACLRYDPGRLSRRGSHGREEIWMFLRKEKEFIADTKS